ncbi:hypothetical protein SLS62_007220 [Diatrype stigma]|uniref:Mediator of RNA polymerase II transcription subunit 4 n=1 Tax=Diatrype stigma TaxID=117547 RepID=A0AAN9UN15_9PEZI
MDKQLDTRFDRVERALGTLADSIAKYNPSTHSAREFVAADAELSKGLEELQTHQFNYRRLQDLRAASASLDAQIKDTLRLLATTRKELVSTPATVFPDGARHYYDIDYDELLRYARMISKTTMPPVGAVNGLPTPPAEPFPGAAAGGVEIVAPGIETAATTPGATASGVATPGGAATPNGMSFQSGANGGGMTPQPPQSSSGGGDQPPPSSQQQQSSQQPPPPSQATTAVGTSFNTSSSTPDANANMATATATMHQLPEIISTHLNPHAQLQFAPWPGEDGVRGGGLAALALLADRGVDPEGYDPEEERARRAREAEEERRAEEEERRAREERERERRVREEARLRAERAARENNTSNSNSNNGGSGQAQAEEAWRRASIVGTGGGAAAGPGGPASSPTGEKKQFQFMGDLDDDDDDD